ncbi:dTDP-4-dehydrorhamnose 3,5-epimerase [Parashewanella spongiae]|uniref:dTDP-4-dehydrorhamnose 3,5-epimerase n=1 Tax=Parashewanella spongiae TaxID=342950 RepID=A0A3A6U9C6_9GAMM|nr:dTDP-4-dehydrorhamnose 3,5-epimerase [Parashewanella spongiae]MCL1077703.1 dTDP-4-dehydrorhamnose 3,5-epimerase [Parashewanella spongiae]RJY18101.1 dTDP-4-dehydrorhamnose 3,5-epimerase [Parashewanella spongiae]
MNILDTRFDDVKILEPQIFEDERGFFQENWHQNKFKKNIADVDFVQDNYSRSIKGTLRGLHFQQQQPQGKLIQVLAGKIFDVVVDVRSDSATYGQWFGATLSAENYRQLWVPAGFAHGFYVLSNTVDCLYKCTNFYHPESEVCIKWDDPELAIDWPLSQAPLLSDKDARGINFSSLFVAV